MRLAAKTMACRLSDSLRATARPPSKREHDEDGNHHGDYDRGTEILPRRERGGRGDRGRERLAERVLVTVVARREHEAVRDDRGAEDVLRRGGFERPDQGPARRVQGIDGPACSIRREDHLAV